MVTSCSGTITGSLSPLMQAAASKLIADVSFNVIIG
jgi:hypothetical protein